MQVKELITALSKFNGDNDVFIKYKDTISTLDGTDDLELRIECLPSKVNANIHEEPVCCVTIDTFPIERSDK